MLGFSHFACHRFDLIDVIGMGQSIMLTGGTCADEECNVTHNIAYFFLIKTTEVFRIRAMNSKQMKKWLEQQGAIFQQGKGSHLKVFLNDRQSALPMHGTTELGKGLEAAIKRQLGLK